MASLLRPKRSIELLLEHCLVELVSEPPRPATSAPKDRLDAVLGRELAQRLVAALSPKR